MFGFNFKKHIELNDLPDKWTVMKAEEGKNILIIRLLSKLEMVTKKKEYPIRIGIAVPLANTNISTETQKQLQLLEDEVIDIFRKKSQGRMYAVITRMGENQFREFVVQSKDNLNFAEIHGVLRQKFHEFEVQMVANKDEDWKMYHSIKAGQI